MKILFDHQAFSLQKYGGISRFLAAMIYHLSNDTQTTVKPYFGYTENVYVKEYGLQKNTFKIIRNLKSTLKERILKVALPHLNKIGIINLLIKQDFDLFIPTYYDTYFIPYLKKKPFVFIVYDMIHERYPEYYPNSHNLIQSKKRLALRADLIIAISHNTKNDLLAAYPEIQKDKIKVVYLSHSFDILKPNKSDVGDKYILFVGSRARYKNWTTFIRGCVEALQIDPVLRVVCIGGGALDNTEIELLSSLNIADRVVQLTADEPTLYTYYINAQLFVFPSLYEGFGIPIVESMYSGCPVLLGDHSSFREVAQEAAYYTDVNNSNEISKAIIDILSNKELRDSLISKGIKRAEAFSWKQSAIQFEAHISKLITS